MKVYLRETEEIMGGFFKRKITFPECIAALDVALANLMPKLEPYEILGLRAVMLANNELVMDEMTTREGDRKTSIYATGAVKNRHASN